MADEPRPTNYHRLNAVVDHLLHLLTKNEARTYMLMLRHTDSATGEVELGNPFICSRLCTDEKSAREALDGLVRHGAIVRIADGGGRHNVPRYVLPVVEARLLEEGCTTNIIPPHNTPPLKPGVYSRNPGRRAPETPGAVPVNPGRHAPKTPGAVPPRIKTHKDNTTNPPPPGGGGDRFAEQRGFLASVGVNWTPDVRAGVVEHAWSERELRAAWSLIVTKRPQGKRQGAMAAAVRDGHKPRPQE